MQNTKENEGVCLSKESSHSAQLWSQGKPFGCEGRLLFAYIRNYSSPSIYELVFMNVSLTGFLLLKKTPNVMQKSTGS